MTMPVPTRLSFLADDLSARRPGSSGMYDEIAWVSSYSATALGPSHVSRAEKESAPPWRGVAGAMVFRAMDSKARKCHRGYRALPCTASHESGNRLRRQRLPYLPKTSSRTAHVPSSPALQSAGLVQRASGVSPGSGQRSSIRCRNTPAFAVRQSRESIFRSSVVGRRFDSQTGTRESPLFRDQVFLMRRVFPRGY